MIVLHEATRTGGPGGEVAALIAERAFEYLDAPIVRVAPPDTPVPYSPPLEEYFLPNAREGGQGHPGALRVLTLRSGQRCVVSLTPFEVD